MAYKQPEWLSRNSVRSYPIRQDAPRTASSGFSIPDSLLADVFLCVDNEPNGICISSVCITPAIVTVVFASVTSGESVAMASAFPGRDEALRRKEVHSISSGVSGYVVFGSFLDEEFSDVVSSFSGTNRFDRSCVLETRCVVDVPKFPVASLRASSSLETISGDATMSFGGNLVAAITSGTDLDSEELTYVTISLEDPAQFAPVCAEAPDQSLCGSYPILSINDVVPDINGNITVEFVGFTSEQIASVMKASLLLTGSAFCSKPALPNDSGQLPPSFTD